MLLGAPCHLHKFIRLLRQVTELTGTQNEEWRNGRKQGHCFQLHVEIEVCVHKAFAPLAMIASTQPGMPHRPSRSRPLR